MRACRAASKTMFKFKGGVEKEEEDSEEEEEFQASITVTWQTCGSGSSPYHRYFLCSGSL
jgi:hypothetical protein